LRRTPRGGPLLDTTPLGRARTVFSSRRWEGLAERLVRGSASPDGSPSFVASPIRLFRLFLGGRGFLPAPRHFPLSSFGHAALPRRFLLTPSVDFLPYPHPSIRRPLHALSVGLECSPPLALSLSVGHRLIDSSRWWFDTTCRDRCSSALCL
jgi:hypothetical protein